MGSCYTKLNITDKFFIEMSWEVTETDPIMGIAHPDDSSGKRID